MKRQLFILICSAASLSAAHSQQTDTYTNPVIAGELADPSIIRIGADYYATGTSSEWAPFYPVFTSTDLVNWKQTGHLFDKQPEWTTSSFWAPELYHHNNQVYAYYTARNKAGVSYIGAATADSPTGKFTDHGVLVEFGSEAIDAFVLEDNGQLYMTWKAYGLDNRPIELLCSKLSADGLRLEGEPFSLMRDDERIGMEGQYWFKKGDYYYMIYSTHSCCGPKSDYQVRVARAKQLEGPYETYSGNPILHGEGAILSCGHGTVTTTPDGRMFYLCHAYQTGENFYTGRQAILQELIINKENWIEFTTGTIAQLQQTVPFKGTVQHPAKDFEDSFDSPTLKPDWTWNYPYATMEVQTGKGRLQLSGIPKEGHINGTALCIRPVRPNYTIQTHILNQNSSLKGLTLYGDDQNFIAFGYKANKLVVKEVNNGKETVLSEQPLTTSAPYLKIEVARGTHYSFLWSKDGKVWQAMPTVAAEKDGSSLVRWDRIARPGLIHCGEAKQVAEFAFFTCSLSNK